jgi:hypothetical protein
MSTLAVVEEILRETEVPMSVREIVERAGVRLPSKSKTPDTVVARDLAMDIKKKGEASLFARTSPGRYTLRALALAVVPAPEHGEHAAVIGAEATPLAPAAMRATGAAPLATIPARKPAAAAAPSSPSSSSSSSSNTIVRREADGGGYAG